MKPITACVLVMATTAFAKDKPQITIQVIKSQPNLRQWNVMVGGRNATSQTKCNTMGTANATGMYLGNGLTTANATGNADTNCTTTTTPAIAPHEVTRSVEEEYVSAVLPGGRNIMLWCQQGYRKCLDLAPGRYQAEVSGDALFVHVPELSGKDRKVKYKTVTVDPVAPQN